MGTRFGLSIRAADASEAAPLATLLAEAGLRLGAAEIAERIATIGRLHGTILLAHEWGPPSGVVVLAVEPSLAEARPIGRITFLMVGVEARRRGIGRLLVKAAAQAARTAGCGSLRADGIADADHSGDHAFAAFWRASGFSETGAGWSRPLRKKVG